MKKKSILIFGLLTLSLIFGLLTLNLSTPVKAQDYSFDVNSEKVNVYIEKDGSISIEYEIKFTCHYGAHEIDWVDIGFPNKYYDIDSIQADIDGHRLTNINPSSYIDIGIEIDLGYYAIKPGKSATLHVKGNNPRMIYEDWEDQDLASVEFSPTWFDSDSCPTYEYLEVNFYFPQGLANGNEVKYHYDKYTSYSHASDGDLIYTWVKKNVAMKQYDYGVSFPKGYIDSYLSGSMNPQLVMLVVSILLIISVIGLIAGGSFLLYRYKKKYKNLYYPPKPRKAPKDMVGSVFCFAISGSFIVFLVWAFIGDIVIILALFGIIIAGFGMIGYLIYNFISKRMEKLPYSKPDIKIDSMGVNKDLTVIEAAIIQNIPLKKVVFLIIFSLIRTGHLKIIRAEPLKFEVISTKEGAKMRIYQKKFLNAIIKSGQKTGTVDSKKLEKLLVDLIKSTYSKMSGYKLEETIRYYRNMINDAWKAVKSMPKEIEWEDIEKNFEWVVLDDNFEENSRLYFSNRYYYHRPYWYYNYYYYNHFWYRRHYYNYHPGATVKTQPIERINIHAFSDSIVSGIENMSNTIVTNFTNFAERIIGTVAPVQVKSTSGKSYGGSSGCACACACAGCACACAGGGR